MIDDTDEIEYEELPDEEPDFKIIIDKKPRRGRKQKTETEEYVNKDEMWDEIHNYYTLLGDNYDWKTQKIKDKNKDYPKISNKLTTMLNDIADKMGHRANFSGYTYIDEMCSDAKIKLIKSIRDCSFKCYATVVIISRIIEGDTEYITFYDKKGKIQKKIKESTDVFYTDGDKNMMTMRSNPFGYSSRIVTHSFLNRIKKEKMYADTKNKFAEETWEKFLNSELWANARRPKYIDTDDNDLVYEQ